MKHRQKNNIQDKALKRAAEMGQHADLHDKETVAQKLGKMKYGPVAKIWDKVTTLWNAFKTPDTPPAEKILIIGGLIYLVTPLDIIPDAFFPVGLLDDVAVIAFIYSQCKDLITKTVPEISAQAQNAIHAAGDAACKQINRITETIIIDTAGKQFTRFCRRTFINSLLKLSLFTASLLLLYFSSPCYIPSTAAASLLLIIVTGWFLYSFGRNCIVGIKTAIRFFTIFHSISSNQTEENNRIHRQKPRFQDKAAEALYTAFIVPAIPENKKGIRKICRFMFKVWNEGKLPAWIPGKKELTEHVFNTLKFQLFLFVISFTGYLLVYNLIVKGMLMKSITDFTLWQFIGYPFVYAYHTLFGIPSR